MKSGSLLVKGCNLFAATLFFHITARGETKTIHLRNETILTQPAADLAKRVQSVAPKPVTGLFLVQFNAALKPAEREELRAAGVELLKYVPNDAFIAKFSQAVPDQIRAMTFVRWVGAYRPDHKVHPRLAAAVLAPQATPARGRRFRCPRPDR